MPISWDAPLNGAPFGFGFRFQVYTDLPDPLPDGSEWRLFLMDEAAAWTLTASRWLTTDTAFGGTMGWSEDGHTEAYAVREGDLQGMTGMVRAEVVAPDLTLLDSDVMPIKLDFVTGMPAWQQLLAQSNVSGGLTEEQAQQLVAIHESTVLDQLVDALTLEELHPSGGADYIASALPTWCFGVIVRITSVPPELVPNTPDGDYWYPSLAVVRVFRGADLWMRVPVHTSSKIVSFAGDVITAAVSAIIPATWLLDMSVQVTFRQGVTGRVYLMKAP